MKQYTVYFKEEIPFTYMRQHWNRSTNKWEDKEEVEMEKCHTFYDLTSAKKCIKANLDKYSGSSITKIYANGDWENCGEIKMKGSNAIQMSDMKTAQY